MITASQLQQDIDTGCLVEVQAAACSYDDTTRGLTARPAESVQTDLDLMRQALVAIVASGLSGTKTKQARDAAAAALRARLAEPVQASSDVPKANCGKLNAMQEGRDRYTNKASIMAFVEGAWWAAQQLAAPAAAPTVQSVVVPDGKLPSIIEAVEFRREAYALDQRQWAYVLGMQPSHYSEFLSGTRSLPKSAMAVSYAFGVPADCLFQCRSTLGASDIDRRLSEIAAASQRARDLDADLRARAAEWVGLTGDEISECWGTGNVVAAVETKLREKNA